MAKSVTPPSVKAGIPRLNSVPNGWKKYRFGEILKEVARPIELEDEKVYQLVVAKRSRGGIEPRECLPGRRILTKTQFEIRAGDFLISNRQIVHGACGVVPIGLDGSVVSNEYTVLHPSEHLDLNFLNHYTHTTYFQQTCFHSSVGVDVEKMIFRINEWFKHPVALPPLPEQKKIAEILSCWDRGIEEVEKLLDVCNSQFIAAKNQLINESNSSLKTTVGDLCEVGRGRVISKKELQSNPGAYPVYSSQTVNDGIFGRIGSFDFEGDYLTWTTDGVNAGTVFLRSGKFNCTNVCGTLLPKDPAAVDIKYLLYLLSIRTSKYVSRNLANPKLMNGVMASIPLDLPSLRDQRAISNVLCSMENKIKQLSALRVAIARQKQGLMQQILTGKTRVKGAA
jgi:type I restriction enzyme S subunit